MSGSFFYSHLNLTSLVYIRIHLALIFFPRASALPREPGIIEQIPFVKIEAHPCYLRALIWVIWLQY